MDWINWVLLAVATLAAGTIVYLRMKNYITTDAATVSIGAVIGLVRKAEEIWTEYQGAGDQKKAWVLAQLLALGDKYEASITGELIDAVVEWLNNTQWKQ